MPAKRTIGVSRTRRPANGGAIKTPVQLPSYTVATLPAAASYAGCIVYVSNAATNPISCVSDGTNWKRQDTGATVS